MSDDKSKWPEVVGCPYQEAVAKISKDRPDVNPHPVKDGMFITMDYRLDRAWVWYDPETALVTREPHVG